MLERFRTKTMESYVEHKERLAQKIKNISIEISDLLNQNIIIEEQIDNLILNEDSAQLKSLEIQLKENLDTLDSLEFRKKKLLKSKNNFDNMPIITSIISKMKNEAVESLKALNQKCDNILNDTYIPALEKQIEAKTKIDKIRLTMDQIIKDTNEILPKDKKILPAKYIKRIVEYPTIEDRLNYIRSEKEQKRQNERFSKQMKISKKLLNEISMMQSEQKENIKKSKEKQQEKAREQKAKNAAEREKAKNQVPELYRPQNEQLKKKLTI